MNSAAAIYAIRWLIKDTFRQALSTRIFWLMLGASGLCILFCLSVSIDGGESLRYPGDIELHGGDGKPLTGSNPKPGYLSLAFGAIRYPLSRDGAAAVHFLVVFLAKLVAGAAGQILALVWTAGFLPEFLQPSAASVLLAKPVPRWSLLVGKYFGVLAFVALQAIIFFGGTWVALGLKTGFWPAGYLAGIPLLVLSFAFVYSFSALLAVLTRSTVACIFGSVLFWIVCCGTNYGRHATIAMPYLSPDTPRYPASFTALVEVGYWVLPKPADMAILLDESLNAREHFGTLPEFEAVQNHGEFDPDLSVVTSMLFAAGVLAIAARQLGRAEY
jgi:ABC-type transport system involved in multi-copper enzyme maturation permease subunit